MSARIGVRWARVAWLLVLAGIGVALYGWGAAALVVLATLELKR